MASDEDKIAVGYPAGPGYPIAFSVVYPERLSRLKGAQRAAGALITWIVSAGLGYVSAVFSIGLPFPFGPWLIIGFPIACGVISVPIFLALRIRAKGLARFQAEDGPALERYAEYAIASASYALFLTDDSPRQAIGESVRLEVRRGGSFGWLRAAITPLLLVPHILLLAVFAFVFTAVVPVCAVWAIAFQRYPRWLFGFTVGYLRWIARALGYWISLTDRYPPFSFGEQV
ncbi:MAG: DUF4389 domain-containing protein [Chloroflexi bacterium]|nr:DUF4389 domain-containing protein [Chloroflexota bacterium]